MEDAIMLGEVVKCTKQELYFRTQKELGKGIV